jgi:tetratricopeptide (TPR) repeat protein
MAENWVMLITLPLFIAALIALRRMKFFRGTFLLRMTLRGLMGFSIYLLLPLVNGLKPHSPWTFSEAWLESFKATKGIFHTLYYNFWSWHRLPTVLVVIYFLVPTLPCFLKLRNEGLKNKSRVDRLQDGIFLATRVALLLTCLWLAFDPEVGPREIIRQQIGLALPLVTFDYVNALGIAFIAGSLLFAACVPRRRRAHSPLQKFSSFLRRNAFGFLGGTAVIVLLALLGRSLPGIITLHRQPLTRFGETVANGLPTGGGIVISDDEVKLALLRSVLASHADGQAWQTVDLKLLATGKYRAELEKKIPRGWQAAGANDLNSVEVLHLLEGMQLTNRFYYLQPHSGQFVLELFQAQPLGAISELQRHPTNHFERLVVASNTIIAGEKFWDIEWSEHLAGLMPSETRTAKLEKFFKDRLALTPARVEVRTQLGVWYSALLDDWGVTLARMENFPAAQKRFEQALVLNPNNLAARINLLCNSNRMVGQTLSIGEGRALVQKFRSVQQVAQLINACGEVDEPALRCVLGNACLAAGWPRQAWAEFDRASMLAPDSLPPELALVQIYSRLRLDDEVFALVKQLQTKVDRSPAGKNLEVELAVVEAKSWISQTNRTRAQETLSAVLAKYPEDLPVTETIFRSFLAFGDSEGALRLIETQLKKNPDSVFALNNQGALLIQSGHAAEALPVLNHALTVTNLPAIKLNRAIAEMQLRNFSAAEEDYLSMTNALVDQFSVHYGLSQIAEQRRDTNAAVTHLEFCLTNAPAGSAKWQEVSGRLSALGKSKLD